MIAGSEYWKHIRDLVRPQPWPLKLNSSAGKV